MPALWSFSLPEMLYKLLEQHTNRHAIYIVFPGRFSHLTNNFLKKEIVIFYAFLPKHIICLFLHQLLNNNKETIWLFHAVMFCITFFMCLNLLPFDAPSMEKDEDSVHKFRMSADFYHICSNFLVSKYFPPVDSVLWNPPTTFPDPLCQQ